jgi:tryptophanyl-tRNA synthetase
VFIVPEARISEDVKTIPGTDGQKMSKSYNNTIDIFLPEKELKKQIASIVTDSTPLEEPKNPDTCNVFKIYSLVADDTHTEELRQKYLAGNFGYGHAKKALQELIIEKYSEARKIFEHYMSDTAELELELKKGEDKARETATQVLQRTRKTLGFSY